MKYLIFVLVISVLNSAQLFSQRVYFVENILANDNLPRSTNDFEQYYFMIEGKDTFKVKTSGYSFLWKPIDIFNLICSNINDIATMNLKTKEFSKIYQCSNNEIIAELTSSKNFCYFVTQPSNELSCISCRVKVLNIQTGQLDTLPLSDTLNYSGISISPDENNLAFIYTKNKESDGEKYYLLAYDLLDENIIAVDSTMYSKGERFIRDPKNIALSWLSDVELAYYKKEGVKNRIYSYNITTKEKRCLYDLPIDLNSICLKGSNLYYTDDNIIYQFDTNKMLYKTKGNYDFLHQRIFVE